MTGWAWLGVAVLTGITLVILVPMFVHEWKWRHR